MNFDEHDAHDHPRAYVAAGEPRYVGVCPGHQGIGPWSPAVPFVPLDEDAVGKIDLGAGAKYDVAAEIDAWFEPTEEPATGAQWQVWAVSELALAALRGLAREFPCIRYHVALLSRAGDRRAHVLAKRFAADDDRFSTLDDERAVIVTDDVEDVAFLAGYPVRGALCPFITVVARSPKCVAALYFDWDDDRFYIAETSDAVLRHTLWAATALGFEVVDDDGHIFMMSGTPEYVAGLRAWIAGGSKGLPDGLL